MKTMVSSVLTGIPNFTHDTAMTTQAIILYYPFTHIGNANFFRSGIGYNPIYISGSGIARINTAGQQPMRVMTGTTIGCLLVGGMQISIHLFLHNMTTPAETGFLQSQHRQAGQQHDCQTGPGQKQYPFKHLIHESKTTFLSQDVPG